MLPVSESLHDDVLTIEDLVIAFPPEQPGGSEHRVVDGVSFFIRRGETVALVGESGSGKTITCRAALRLTPPSARILSGSVRLAVSGAEEVDVLKLGERALRTIRGGRISMIFQEPMSSLSPLHTIGSQVGEAIRLHRSEEDGRAKTLALDLFERVGFPNPERAWRSYPFELSGGLRQRAMIAMAMSARPDVLIADEPTTALDVTTQAQVLGLIKDLQRETGMGVLLVTHDLGVVANMADAAVVMRKGRMVESGETADVIGAAGHGYTRRLIAAAPEMKQGGPGGDGSAARPNGQGLDAVLTASAVHKTFKERGGGFLHAAREIQALRGVDLELARGESLAVVGESGSGKSTLARVLLGVDAPDDGGSVQYCAAPGAAPLDVYALDPDERLAFRREAQMVFQDPYASLSPRMTLGEILSEPCEIHGMHDRRERRDKAAALMTKVGLSPDMLQRFPHAFSGGQRQRLSIARALMLDPKVLVCDEPTSALDVSVQAQILELLTTLRRERGLTFLFITHDLAVASQIADRVAVMREGRVVETAIPEVLFEAPAHPYTKALIAASPTPDLGRKLDLELVAKGAGAPESWPEAFRFDEETAPPLRETAPGHWVRALG